MRAAAAALLACGAIHAVVRYDVTFFAAAPAVFPEAAQPALPAPILPPDALTSLRRKEIALCIQSMLPIWIAWKRCIPTSQRRWMACRRLPWTGSPASEIYFIAVLVMHVAGSERFWIGEKAGAMPANRDRASEFRGADNAAVLRQVLDESLTQAHAVLAALESGGFDASAGTHHDGKPIDVVWGRSGTSLNMSPWSDIQLTRSRWLATTSA